MLTQLLLALSVALAHAATNFDNLALVAALSPAVGARRALTGFSLAQATALVAAAAVGAGAAAVGEAWLGWFGLAPLTLGLIGLWRNLRGEIGGTPRLPAKAALPAVTLLFLGCSIDSFAVVAAFYADSAGEQDIAVALGSLLSLSALAVAGAALSQAAARLTGATQRLERLAPIALIASGIYILADTPTDML